MSAMQISDQIRALLKKSLKQTKRPELISAYLHYVEHAFRLEPVLFVRDRMVYRSVDDAVNTLEEQGALWRETEIKIGYTPSSVNEQTTKIYICPFSGKVFGDNTHPRPQDAIYDWVSTCPENTERVGGLKVKRFYISDDPEVIKAYAAKYTPKAPITKIVFSSAVNGKLFHSKEAVIEDFKTNYLKRVSLSEVQHQSRFQIEPSFMLFIQEQLQDEKIAAFVEALSEIEDFAQYVEMWLGEVEGEEGEAESL